MSFDLNALSAKDRTACHDAFALFVIEMTTGVLQASPDSSDVGVQSHTTSINRTGVIDGLDHFGVAVKPEGTVNAGIASQTASSTAAAAAASSGAVQPHVSLRQRWLGWIPGIGPMLSPSSGAAVANELSAKAAVATVAADAASAAIARKAATLTVASGSAASLSADPSAVAVGSSRHMSAAAVGKLERRDSTASASGAGTETDGDYLALNPFEPGSGFETDSSYDKSMLTETDTGTKRSLKVADGFARSLCPTSEELNGLGLVSGANTIQFVVEGGGGIVVSAKLYLWSPHAKIFVSDVDGTITKSDVLGHILYYVGRDWTHAGVAKLYSNVVANGYHIMYLTSRAIGQTEATKGYLQGIKQTGDGGAAALDDVALDLGAAGTSSSKQKAVGKHELKASAASVSSAATAATSVKSSTSSTNTSSKNVKDLNSSSASISRTDTSDNNCYTLPPGPVITSPDRLIDAFTREVIKRRPHEFKIAALSGIKKLFPPDARPFYAGFGNRDTDVISYTAVGIPIHKCFIINPEGLIQLVKANRGYRTSYVRMNSLVHEMFPSMTESSVYAGMVGDKFGKPLSLDDRYNDLNHWRMPFKEIPESELAASAQAASAVVASILRPAKPTGKPAVTAAKPDAPAPATIKDAAKAATVGTSTGAKNATAKPASAATGSSIAIGTASAAGISVAANVAAAAVVAATMTSTPASRTPASSASSSSVAIAIPSDDSLKVSTISAAPSTPVQDKMADTVINAGDGSKSEQPLQSSTDSSLPADAAPSATVIEIGAILPNRTPTLTGTPQIRLPYSMGIGMMSMLMASSSENNGVKKKEDIGKK
jgi:hypothetical protein